MAKKKGGKSLIKGAKKQQSKPTKKIKKNTRRLMD